MLIPAGISSIKFGIVATQHYHPTRAEIWIDPAEELAEQITAR
jgi:hypothetical protein